MTVSENQPPYPDYALWSDNPSPIDLLAFAPVAKTVADALLDDALDPVALGISGRWGSGKTTILNLVEQELDKRNQDDAKILVVTTEPWRYDPASGVKESLISEVLSALDSEVNDPSIEGGDVQALFKRLVQRVDWAKAVSIAAKTSLTMQLPSLQDIVGLVKEPGDGPNESTRGLDAFRNEFGELIGSASLDHIRRVAVLVDDLDRCLPSTVIETLEGIRLFLAVPRMSFVIAADEERIADAIRTRYQNSGRQSEVAAPAIEEEPAKLYLHKIVQTTVPVPSLSRFDTEAYLILLQISAQNDIGLLRNLAAEFDNMRGETSDLNDFTGINGNDLAAERDFAERLTPILYEKLRGNPRRVKRFLNDLHVRQSIATRRGIDLETAVVAKMMVLEQLLPRDFDRVLGWLASGVLRVQMGRLETAAGQTPPGIREVTPKDAAEAAVDVDGEELGDEIADEADFEDSLLRWAKLAPSLGDVDLSAYLHLAASFAGQTVLDGDLPERLRDLAARFLSEIRADQYSVVDTDLRILPSDDASLLMRHMGKLARDRPSDQRRAIEAILRISRQHVELADHGCAVLQLIPADEVRLPALLLFNPNDDALRPALDHWLDTTSKTTTRNAIVRALGDERQV